MTIFVSLLLVPLALAGPLAQPHGVRFQTADLPAGVSFTISGLRTNPGEQEAPYSIAFTSPGPNNAMNTEPGTNFTYEGFPASVDVGGVTYTLVSTAPASPFTTGGSSETTTVVATYTACPAPVISDDPDSLTVTYGQPASFSVVASGNPPFTYQWYLNGNPILNATLSTYDIAAATMADAGDYTVTVTNACGSSATSAAATLTVNKADQTITFVQPPSPAVYGTTFTVAPTASSGLPVTLVASGSCSNTGFDVTMTSGEGTCTLTASQAGNMNYNAATDVVREVAAAKADQTITFVQPPSPAVYGTTFTVAPTASSGLVVTLVASGSCSNTGFDVSMTSGEGTCTLTASQPGNSNYNAATDVMREVAAAKADQTISFVQPPSPADYLSTFGLTYSASSGLTVSMVASGSCTLLDAVTAQMSVPYGACLLTASQAGNGNYNAAQPVERTVDSSNTWLLYGPILSKP
jgi:hypothetical protein